MAKAKAKASAKRSGASPEPKIAPYFPLLAPLSAARAALSDFILRFWSLFHISEIRRLLGKEIACSCGKGRQIIPARAYQMIRLASGAFAALLPPCGKCGKSEMIPAAAYAPSHSAFWAYRRGRAIKMRALDSCPLNKAEDSCSHGLPSWIAALGWINAAIDHPAASRSFAPPAAEAPQGPARAAQLARALNASAPPRKGKGKGKASGKGKGKRAA